MGLTTALLLQDTFPAITIVASEFPTSSPIKASNCSVSASVDYASMWAGAHYRPVPYLPRSAFGKFDLSHQQQEFQLQLAREKQLAVTTAKVMKDIASRHPESGVEIVRGEEYLESPPVENLQLVTGEVYASEGDGFRVLKQSELAVLNRHTSAVQKGEVKWGCAYETYVVNVHIYCAWLLDRFLSNGGKTAQRTLQQISDAFELVDPYQKRPSLVINCSGRNFEMDPAVKYIRGQTVLVRNQYDKTITRQCADGAWSFLIPRPLNGGTIVGGTKEIDDTETDPRPDTRQKLLENAVKYFPDLVTNVKDFDIVTDNVGRRPWRAGGLRIETEHMAPGKIVIHGYGAGGRGYELSWGIAHELSALVKDHMNNTSNPAAKL